MMVVCYLPLFRKKNLDMMEKSMKMKTMRMKMRMRMKVGYYVRFGGMSLIFWLFRATPEAYGDSQARGRIRATAAGLHCTIATPDPSRVCVLHHRAHDNAGSLTP